MFQFGSTSQTFYLFPNTTSIRPMLHQAPHNCTIPYFRFFSKQEMCSESIFRHFFYLLGVLYLFFHTSPAFSTPSELTDNPATFFKMHAPSPTSIDLKKLAPFPKKFPDSPLQIYVYYYLACDACNSAKKAKNREKQLLKAIDYFNHAEIAWMRFFTNKMIPPKQIDNYNKIKDDVALGAAQAYLTLAEPSQGLKKDIFLAQAENRLNGSFSSEQQPKLQFLQLWLQLMKNNNQGAQFTLSAMQDKLSHNNTYLHQAYLLLAKKEFSVGNTLSTLRYLSVCSPQNLSQTQKLDLWLLQSLCLRNQGKFHEAHLSLSKAINSPVASSQRLRAMCLRACIFEEEERFGLAAKQWESIASKNSRWAQMAKDKVKNARSTHPAK